MQSSRPVPHRQSFRRFCVLLGISLFVLASALSAQSEGTRTFNIPADAAEKTLKLFSEQSGRGLIMNADTVGAVRTNAVQGDLKPAEALTRMLANTPLVATEDRKSGSYVVKLEKAPAEKNAVSRPASDRAAADAQDGALKLDTFEVMGTKLLNMDVTRSRDDAQPYVIFDRDTIEQSGSTNLENFLKNRLTMNTQSAVGSQTVGGTIGNISQINLRGLGSNQTLILVDGHRAASVSIFGTAQQSDINWIPMAAVQRIEVLPTTASGIFGGSATGGAINIILRRNYSGGELKLTYENTVHADAPLRRVDLSTGFSLEDGKTSVLIAASWSDSATPTVADRDFLVRGRARILANNPAFFLSATNPTLGATPNIRSTAGTNLTLKNGTALNSPITHVPTGYQGTAADGGAALVANAGSYNFTPTATNQASLGAGGFGLFTTPRVESIMGTVRRRFSERVEAFLDASMANNVAYLPFNFSSGAFNLPAAAPTNPFNQAITVTMPVNGTADSVYGSSNYDRRIVGGVIMRLTGDWKAEADYTWNQTRYTFTNPRTFTPMLASDVSNGVLNPIRDVRANPIDFTPYLGPSSNQFLTPLRTTLRDAALRVSGPVYSLPAGSVTLACLLEYRDEYLDDGFQTTYGSGVSSYAYRPSRSQSTGSVYLEARLPIFSEHNRYRGLELLELQVAARADEYRIRGSSSFFNLAALSDPIPPILRNEVNLQSVDPTVGLRYSPVKGVTLRASYGTGFVPPSASQLITIPATPNAATMTVNDPRRGNQATPLTAAQFPRTGGNPNLRPENSKSFSAGVVLSLPAVPDLRLSVDYTRIRKTDIITTLTPQGVVDNEASFPDRVTRAPLAAGDPFSVGQIIALDTSAVNLSNALVEAYDIAADYTIRTEALGTANLYLLGTWQTHYQTQASPIAPFLENVGISSNNPLKFKANAGLTWKYGRWTLNWIVRYFDDYLVANPAIVSSAPTILNQGDNGRVPSQFYHDLSVSHRLGRGFSSDPNGRVGRSVSGLLARTEVTVGVKNLFDEEPPFDAATSPRFYSPYGDARLASYFISLKTAF